MTGGLIGLLETAASEPSFAQQLVAAAAQSTDGGGMGSAIGQHDSKNFWDSFGSAAETPDTAPSGVHGRGLFKKPAAAGGSAVASDRVIDYYHYYTDPTTKEKSLRLATSIDPNELMDHEGDISASVNVNGFHMAGEDRATFDQLQSAQLRIDMVQTQSLIPNYLDTMAWMSMAGLFPDKTGKLPPLQDLTFNPSTSGGGKMNQMVLPGGSGQMAVNLSMTHKESMFYSVIKSLSSELGRFSPLIGLPAISVTALKGFCSLYGALEQRTTFLLNSMPKPAYATQAARESAQTGAGLNLVAGDYILVPNAYSAQLVPYLDKLEMRQGYLVPKGSPKTTSVYDLAASLKPDITYLSASLGLKPFVAPPPAASKSSVPVSQTDTPDDSEPAKPASKGPAKSSGTPSGTPAKSGTTRGTKPGA